MQQSGLIFNIQKYSIHDGPGIRTTVFLKGCPLRCAWCANPESQNSAVQPLGGKADSRPYTVEEVVHTCLQDAPFYEESGGGVTLSGGEPLAQEAFALALLAALRKAGLHTAIETTGCAPEGTFLRAATLANLLLFDVKHHDDAKHREGTGVSNRAILHNLRSAVTAGHEVLARIPVIPGYNDSEADAAAFAALLRRCGLTRVQLLPFHQMGDSKYTQLGLPYALRVQKPLYPEDLAAYRDVFLRQGVEAFF